MSQYFFVQNPDAKQFEEDCSQKLQEGWMPQGGISMVLVNDQFYYAQAFIR